LVQASNRHRQDIAPLASYRVALVPAQKRPRVSGALGSPKLTEI